MLVIQIDKRIWKEIYAFIVFQTLTLKFQAIYIYLSLQINSFSINYLLYEYTKHNLVLLHFIHFLSFIHKHAFTKIHFFNLFCRGNEKWFVII